MKKNLLIFLMLIPISSQANSSLEDELNHFVENKFSSEKYEDFDFYDFDYIESFDPESISLDKETFTVNDIEQDNRVNNTFDFEYTEQATDPELENLKKKYTRLKTKEEIKKEHKKEELNLVPNDILKIANTIPLLKTKHSKLIQTIIEGDRYFFIKFETPQQTNISFKKIATLSLPENHVKNLEKIENLSNKIKLFNKINSDAFFVNKKHLYIPIDFLK